MAQFRMRVLQSVTIFLLATLTILLLHAVDGANEDGHSLDGILTDESFVSTLFSHRHSALLTRLRSYDRTRPQLDLLTNAHTMGAEGQKNSNDIHGMYPIKQEFKLNAFGKKFDIRIEKNDRMFAGGYQNIRSVNKTSEHDTDKEQVNQTNISGHT